MEECFRCGINDKEARLFEVVYEDDIVKMCHRCAIIEGLPIIKKPSTIQLRQSERTSSVYERLKKLSGMEKEKKHESILEQLRDLDKHPELEMPEEKKELPFNLIENFHWKVMMARKNKGLSQKQLGWALGESETAIKMIEKAELPEDAEKLIKKLEQFFQIRLRELTEEEIEEERKKKEEKLRKVSKIPQVETEKLEKTKEFQENEEPIKPILQEEDIADIASGKSIETQEKKDVILESAEEDIKEKQKKFPSRILSFKPETMKDVTVQDLKKLKDEKEREERLSQIEEERKKSLQAEGIVQTLEKEEQDKQELRKRVAEEMKDVALGKQETVEEKREMLNKALQKTNKQEKQEKTGETEKEKRDDVPKIHELMEKKQHKEDEKMTGDEIEIDESGKSEKEEISEQ